MGPSSRFYRAGAQPAPWYPNLPLKATNGDKTNQSSENFADAPWDLYNVDADLRQANDLAATIPNKLKQLQAKVLEEAKK